MQKYTQKKMTNKEIVIWFIILLFPLLFALLVASIKEENLKPNITKITYVHIFYVPKTGIKEEVGKFIDSLNLDCQIVYHNISDEGNLYQKVVEYFEFPMEVYNPLIAVNDKAFKEFNKDDIEKVLKEQIAIYSHDNISNEKAATYNIVDRIAIKEEIKAQRSN